MLPPLLISCTATSVQYRTQSLMAMCRLLLSVILKHFNCVSNWLELGKLENCDMFSYSTTNKMQRFTVYLFL